MIKRVIPGLIAIFAMQSFVLAQPKELNYYDLEIGRHTHLKPQTLKGLRWLSENELIHSGNDTVYVLDVQSPGEKKPIFTKKQLNETLVTAGLEKLEGLPSRLVPLEGRGLRFRLKDKVFRYTIEEGKLEKLFEIPETASDVEYSPNNEMAVYTMGQNLYLARKKAKAIQLSFDSVPGILNGHTVHRHEFGGNHGAFWSPCGKKVAYYRKDETMVEEYPLVYINSRVAKNKSIRYPMAGLKSEEVDVMIYNLSENSTIKLKIEGDPEQYHTNLSWSPDGEGLYIQHLNRGQDTMHLVRYNVKTGIPADTLFVETHPKYVEPSHELLFSKQRKGDFLYQSARSGFKHIYYFDHSKGQLNQLTRGDWEVTRLLGFDAEETAIFFMGTKESPLERHLYKLNIDKRKIKQLTSQKGTHKIDLSPDKKRFVDWCNSTEVPGRITLNAINAGEQAELLNAPDPLQGYTLGKTEMGTLKSADAKTDLHYKLIKPVNFDPGKKYPAIFYIYGGPHAQLVKNTKIGRSELWLQYMASKGYVGVMLDTRGSSGRGMKFENVIHRQSGIPQMEDIDAAVKWLVGQGYVDKNRLGVHGWSYGGYMTISLMTKYPNLFKVGVAGGPVIDWGYYEVMYGERYMDTPDENPEGYKQCNLNNYAGQLNGKLKIIHGAVDPVVVWQHSLSFIQSCIKAGVFPDSFIYPLHKHNVSGGDRVHLVELISSYFLEHL